MLSNRGPVVDVEFASHVDLMSEPLVVLAAAGASSAGRPTRYPGV